MTKRKKIPDPRGPSALALNDGRDLVGHVVKQDDEFWAFDASDRVLGTFDTLIEAARKIGSAKP